VQIFDSIDFPYFSIIHLDAFCFSFYSLSIIKDLISLCFISHVYNFRIFNIFHANEEPNRFIKSCFLAKQNNTEITIFEDKYFDFVHEDDFIIVLKHYIDSVGSPQALEKTVNICYEQKYKLSEIAKMILGNDENKIHILNSNMNHNYCGMNECLKKMKIELNGLENGLLKL
jgi:hypothetical protein